ncbi:MAG TPA: NAD(P)/FAD-dependent oxidoreductase [Acidimicrobiales bacterium]|nr:NAD(P)/FAD-dependent oxidoreductase [Acidimicrobiales bacterium]
MSVNSAKGDLDAASLEKVVLAANLPTLLMSLYQLTGDLKWLRDPYRPTRFFGMDEHRTGGFSDEIQGEIRQEAVRAITAWKAGRPVTVPAPTGSLLLDMASCYLAEQVPGEYEPMMARQMGFTGAGEARRPEEDCEKARRSQYSVAIIGAGISGMFAALRLRELGVPYVILERLDGVGGVWRQNRYPGAGVDTPSALYSFGFFPRAWSSHFARQPEVLQYLEDFADEFSLQADIRFNTEVVAANWDDVLQCWDLSIHHGGQDSRIVVSAVISAVGLFKEPAMPDIPGRQTFEGLLCHSAQWPENSEVHGNRLAVIGSGASAMQVVSAVANEAAKVVIFQRTPQWISPIPHYFNPVTADEHWLLENVPFYRTWYRARLSWLWNDKVHASHRVDPHWEFPDRSVNEINERHRIQFVKYIEAALADRPDLVERSIPNYPPFGKRMLMDNGWYDALRKPNVELVTEAVTEITPHGVRTSSGTKYSFDQIVMCTGFQTHHYLQPIDFRGREGIRLHEVWRDDNASAYLGTTTPGFPNLFMMYGPATNAGGGSFLSLVESWFGSILTLISKMIETGSGAVEVRQDVHDQYNESLDAANSKMVWCHPSVTNYARNSQGRVTVNMPWRIVDFWTMNQQIDLSAYTFQPPTSDRLKELDRSWPDRCPS